MSHLYETYRKQECVFCRGGSGFIEPVGTDEPRFHRVRGNHILTIEQCRALPPAEWWKRRLEEEEKVIRELRESSVRAGLGCQRSEEIGAREAVRS